MKSKLETQLKERNKNLREGETIVYSDTKNYNRYMVISDQEVLTGDIQIVDLNDDGTFDKYSKSQRIINLYTLQYGWSLEGEKC